MNESIYMSLSQNRNGYSDDQRPLIASVLLNYNSEADLQISAPQLASQENVNHIIIVVDNASKKDSVDSISHWLKHWRSDLISGSYSEVAEWVNANPSSAASAGQIYFIKNADNRGYSAGNNIGARLAAMIGCDLILIINPDVRINDRNYLSKLSSRLLGSDNSVIAASAIYNLSGTNENPMRPLTFFNELFLPLKIVSAWFGINSMSKDVEIEESCSQVSGSCFLIKKTFLEEIGYFDEGVFLYCEESIIASQVMKAGKSYLYCPDIQAVHAHHSSAKGGRTRRTSFWIESRSYYLRKYTKYGAFSHFMLRISHHAMLNIMRIRDKFG